MKVLINSFKTLTFITLLLFHISVRASLVYDLHFYSGIAAKSGYSYFIEGKGFLYGDKLLLEESTRNSTFVLDLSIVNDEMVKFHFPDGLYSGE